MPISIDINEKEVKKIPEKKERKFFFRKKKQSISEQSSIHEKRKINWRKVILFSAISLVAGGLVYGGFRLYKIITNIGIDLSVSDIVPSEEVLELEKDSTGKYTSILIVGIDTREDTGGLNTDTLMIATYNYDTNNITMVSVPRDFYVKINGENGSWYDKINAVYAYSENGLEDVKDTMEDITGIEIQYYAMVDFEGFVDIIDTLGGVTINVETSFTDYYYPADEDDPEGYYECGPEGIGCGFWKTISFKAGVQHMDGETALEYARSRHSSQDGLDWGRARRQQKVVEAVKNAVLDSKTYTNAQKVLSLINTIGENITLSKFTVNDIKAGLSLIQTFEKKEGKTYSFVLDPSAGNKEVISSDGHSPLLGLGKYTDIHEYIQSILGNPAFYEDDANIYVYNTGLGYQETYEKVEELRDEFPYISVVFMGTLYTDKQGTVIYEHETGDKPNTLSTLSSYLNPDSTTKPDYITTNLNGEDISIFFGSSIVEEDTSQNE